MGQKENIAPCHPYSVTSCRPCVRALVHLAYRRLVVDVGDLGSRTSVGPVLHPSRVGSSLGGAAGGPGRNSWRSGGASSRGPEIAGGLRQSYRGAGEDVPPWLVEGARGDVVRGCGIVGPRTLASGLDWIRQARQWGSLVVPDLFVGGTLTCVMATFRFKSRRVRVSFVRPMNTRSERERERERGH